MCISLGEDPVTHVVLQWDSKKKPQTEILISGDITSSQADMTCKGSARKVQLCPVGQLPRLTTNPLNVEVFAIAKAIAKWCLDFFFFCFTLIGSLFRELIFHFTMISKQLITGFQNGPHCFLGWIPHYTGTENGRRMEDLRWTVSFSAHGNASNGFSMRFNGIFSLRLTMFSLYSDFAGTN